jgi:hypothetical protein
MTVQPRALAVSVPTVKWASSPTANANVPLYRPGGLHTFPSRMNLKRRVTHLPRVARLLMDSKILKSVVFLTSSAQSTALGLSIKMVNASAFLRALTGSVTLRRARCLMNNLIGPQPRKSIALSRSIVLTIPTLFGRTACVHASRRLPRTSVTLRRAHCLTNNLIGPKSTALSKSTAPTRNTLSAKTEYAPAFLWAPRRSVALRRAHSMNNVIGTQPQTIAIGWNVPKGKNLFNGRASVHAS